MPPPCNRINPVNITKDKMIQIKIPASGVISICLISKTPSIRKRKQRVGWATIRSQNNDISKRGIVDDDKPRTAL